MAAEKLIRDRLEERVLAGGLRNEADPARIATLLDARLDQDVADLRATERAEAGDYANIFEVLLARAAREGISREQIEAARWARLEERGGFDSGLVWRPPDPVFSVAHEIRCRLRFIGAVLKGDAAACQAAAAHIAALAGVESAEANPRTGSLIVWHDGAPSTRKRIIRALEEFSRAPVAGEVARPVLHPHGTTGLAASIEAAVEQGIEKAAEEVVEEAVRAAAASVL